MAAARKGRRHRLYSDGYCSAFSRSASVTPT